MDLCQSISVMDGPYEHRYKKRWSTVLHGWWYIADPIYLDKEEEEAGDVYTLMGWLAFGWWLRWLLDWIPVEEILAKSSWCWFVDRIAFVNGKSWSNMNMAGIFIFQWKYFRSWLHFFSPRQSFHSQLLDQSCNPWIGNMFAWNHFDSITITKETKILRFLQRKNTIMMITVPPVLSFFSSPKFFFSFQVFSFKWVWLRTKLEGLLLIVFRWSSRDVGEKNMAFW